MTNKYILVGHDVKRVDDLVEWALWMETAKTRVAETIGTVKIDGQNVGQVRVSTIFLGLDHSFGNGPPLLFETMIFGGPLDQEQERCSTWEEAEKQHERMIGKLEGFYAAKRTFP